MCGYCVESGFIQLSAGSIYGGQFEPLSLDSLMTVLYFQEVGNITEGIEYIKKLDNYQVYLETIMCRFFEKSVLYGFDPGLSNTIISAFNNDAITAFLDKMSRNANDELWERLGKIDTYTHQTQWIDLIGRKEDLVMYSVSMLHFYENWWLHGHNKEQAESAETRMMKTGVFDPIENTTRNDFEKFTDLFPVFYLSLIFLQKYSPQSELIRQIALTEPHDVPFFTGEDLWLRRTAFAHCTKQYGISFLMDKLEEIRYELICYILLKVELQLSDLHELSAVLSNQPRRSFESIDLDYTLALINEVIKQKKPYHLRLM